MAETHPLTVVTAGNRLKWGGICLANGVPVHEPLQAVDDRPIEATIVAREMGVGKSKCDLQ